MNVNKKGYIFVELLIVTAILMVGLIVLYKQFSSSITIQKQKLKYNSVADVYKIYYTTMEYFDEINNHPCTKTSKGYNCGDFRNNSGLNENANIYRNLKDQIGSLSTYKAFDIQAYILTECGTYNNSTYTDTIASLKSQINNDSGLSSNFKSYVKTLKTCKLDSDEALDYYRFVAQFKNKITLSSNYAYIMYPN